MPFAIDCVCAGSNLLLCSVTALKLVTQEVEMPYGTLQLLGGPDIISIGEGNNEYPLEPVATWLAAWNDLYIYMTAERSLNSDEIDSFYCKFWIETTFTCEDGDGGVSSTVVTKFYNTEFDDDTCYDGALLAYGSIGRGKIGGAIIRSFPLASCYGFAVQGGAFEDPNSVQVIDLSFAEEGTACICPVGGTAPYVYTIKEGKLPTGLTLDGITGCIEGTLDPSRNGSEQVTIMAVDASRPSQIAEVTCRFIFCSKVQDYGNDSH